MLRLERKYLDHETILVIISASTSDNPQVEEEGPEDRPSDEQHVQPAAGPSRSRATTTDMFGHDTASELTDMETDCD